MQTKHWATCPTCKQITFEITKHRCPTKVMAKIDAQVDMLVDDQMMSWDKDLREFWDSNDVKFFQYDIERRKHE